MQKGREETAFKRKWPHYKKKILEQKRGPSLWKEKNNAMRPTHGMVLTLFAREKFSREGHLHDLVRGRVASASPDVDCDSLRKSPWGRSGLIANEVIFNLWLWRSILLQIAGGEFGVFTATHSWRSYYPICQCSGDLTSASTAPWQ